MKDETTNKNVGETVVLSRVVQAPRALVYQAWTDAARLKEWFSSDSCRCQKLEADVKVGGSYRIETVSTRGEHVVVGKYTELTPNKRVQFTWDAPKYPMPHSVVTVDLEDLGAATRVTLTHRGLPDKEDADDHNRGWTAVTRNLKHWLERQRKANAKADGKSDWVGREFVIKRTFDAPRGMVFQAWTDPEQLAQWWGPRGFTNPVCEWESRAGESLYVVMRGPGGGRYPMGGEFREVAPPERLVFTSGALDETGDLMFEILHTATFMDRDGQTDFTLHSVVTKAPPGTGKYLGGFEAGMGQSLEKLTALLPQTVGPLVVERVFEAPVELVWKALTQKEQIAQWSFEMTDFKPEVGFVFEFWGEKGDVKYHHRCKVTEALPNRKLAYTWQYVGVEGEALVRFELFAEGPKTRLKLTHVGLETFPKVEDYARKNFTKGWTYIIGESLKAHMEKMAASGK